jgi:LAO/AO transport system ATPase
LLTVAGEATHAETIDPLLNASSENTPVIAITGPGGVGKSSLLREIAAHFAKRGESVGILACDPQSPLTGGALLGDRCRIVPRDAPANVFVRSISTAEGHHSIPVNLDRMLRLMRAFGFDRVFLETAGAGQGDTAVRQVADKVVLVVQPQTGDQLQWEKAGLMEVADLVVMNKCDLAGVDQTLAELRESVAVPVVATSTSQHRGIDELCSLLESRLSLRESGGGSSTAPLPQPD